jgi:hypothetical protein
MQYKTFRRSSIAGLAQLEPLEQRKLLSVSIDANGMVTMLGNRFDNTFAIRIEPGNADNIQFHSGGSGYVTFSRAEVRTVYVRGFAGNDTLIVENTYGFVSKTGRGLGIHFEANGGFDRLVTLGDPGVQLYGGYAVGASDNSGALQTINHRTSQYIGFTDLNSIIDSTPAEGITISANGQSNVLEIVNGPRINQQSTAQVNIYNVHVCNATAATGDREMVIQRTFTPIAFTNKAYASIKGLGGDDYIDIFHSEHPPRLATMIIDGGDGRDQIAARSAPRQVSLHYKGVGTVTRTRQFTFVSQCQSIGREEPSPPKPPTDGGGGDPGKGGQSGDSSSHSHSGGNGSDS